MKKNLLCILVIAGLLLTFMTTTAQAANLSNRWMLELNLGAWAAGNDARVTTSFTGVETSYGGTGFGGGVSFGRWLEDNFAVLITVEGRSVDNSVSAGITGVKTETNVVSMIQLQIRYNPFQTNLSSKVHPYLAVAAGPVIGHQGKTSVGLTVSTESVDETAFGGEIAVGTHFILSRHFLVGAEVGALGMTDFGQPIGGRVNYSGAKFGLNFAFLFGGGPTIAQ